MRVPTVESCCCGCNLRLGSAIAGIFFAVANLVQTISYATQANNDPDTKGTLVTISVICALMFALNVMLLYGIHTEREGLLRPWLLIYGLLLLIIFFVAFIGMIIAFVAAQVGIGVSLLIMCFIYVFIYGYCLVVVYSYYMSLGGVVPGTV